MSNYKIIKIVKIKSNKNSKSKMKNDSDLGTKWFSNNKPQAQAIKEMNNKNNQILVGRQTSLKSYSYGSYLNEKELFKYINPDPVDAERNNNHLFEIIQEGKPRKHYFDIEFPLKPTIKPSVVLHTLYKEFNKLIKEVCGIDNFITENNIAISESTGIRKTSSGLREASFHIVVNSDYVFKNEDEQKSLMSYFADKIQYTNDSETRRHLIIDNNFIWDTLVYTKNRQMRLVNNSKFGQSRILKMVNHTKKEHLIGIYNFNEPMLMEFIDVNKVPKEHEVNKKTEDGKTKKIKIKTGQTSQKLKVPDKNFKPPYIPDFDKSKARHLLTLIPNKGEYYQPYYIWLIIGKSLYSIWHERGQKEEEKEQALKRWEEWTTQDETKPYDGECKKYWDTFKYEEQFGMKTILRFVNKCEPSFSIKCEKNKSLSVLFNEQTTIDKFEQETTDTNYYVANIKQFADKGYNVFSVKAIMGLGKSYAVRQFIKSMNFKRVIIISTRCSYAHNVFGELNEMFNNTFKLYNDKTINLSDDIDRLVIQIHSLHKIPENFKPYDCVVIDECESVLNDLTSPIIKERKKCYDRFEKLLNSKYTLFMDAFITKRTLGLAEYQESTYNKKALYIKNNYIPYKFETIRLDGYKQLFNKVAHSLLNGKKCYVFNTKKNGSSTCPDGANNLYKTLIKKFPDKKILLYTGDTTNKKDLKEVNKVWDDVDCIITTSTITVGVNFTKKHFDELFCYATPLTCNQRDIIQGLFRARHINDNKFYFACCTEKYNWFSKQILDYETFVKNFDKKQEQCKVIEKDIEADNDIRLIWNTENKWLKDIHLHNVFERNNKLNNFELGFKRYLSIAGFGDIKEDLETEIEDLLETIEVSSSSPYLHIKDINQEEHDYIRTKMLDGEATKEEKEQVLKFKFHFLVDKKENNYIIDAKDGLKIVSDNSDISATFHKIYKDPILRDKLFNLYYEKKDALKYDYDEVKSDIINENEYRVLSKHRHAKLKVISKLRKIVDLTHSQQTKELTDDELKKIGPDIDELYKSCDKLFDGNLRTKQKGIGNTIKKINVILNHWGFTEITTTTKRKTIKGIKKRINIHTIELSDKYINKSGDNRLGVNPVSLYEEVVKEPTNKKTDDKCLID